MTAAQDVSTKILTLWAENEERVKEHNALASRLDALESQDWKGLMAHMHTMWHDLERRFDELEKQEQPIRPASGRDRKSEQLERITCYITEENFSLEHIQAIAQIIEYFNRSEESEAKIFEFAKQLAES